MLALDDKYEFWYFLSLLSMKVTLKMIQQTTFPEVTQKFVISILPFLFITTASGKYALSHACISFKSQRTNAAAIKYDFLITPCFSPLIVVIPNTTT